MSVPNIAVIASREFVKNGIRHDGNVAPPIIVAPQPSRTTNLSIPVRVSHNGKTVISDIDFASLLHQGIVHYRKNPPGLDNITIEIYGTDSGYVARVLVTHDGYRFIVGRGQGPNEEQAVSGAKHAALRAYPPLLDEAGYGHGH